METPSAIWSWPSAVAGAVVASIGAVLGYLINRRKLPSEVHKTEADANFTEAQEEELRFKTRLSATEMFSEMAADLGELQFEKSRLRAENMKLRERNHILETEVQRFKAERTLHKLKDE